MPAWFAVIEQTPTATSVTEAPLTVHTGAVVLLNVTAKPEVAVAVKATGLAPKAVSGGCVKPMLWIPCNTWNVAVTAAAAAKLPLPAWFAVIEQVPTATSDTDDPLTAHTRGVLPV